MNCLTPCRAARSIEAHPGEDVHFPRRIRIEIDRRIVGDVGQMEHRVERRQIDLVDRPHVRRAHGQARVWRQMIAEPLGIEDGDVVRRAVEHGLSQLRADVSAAAGDQ